MLAKRSSLDNHNWHELGNQNKLTGSWTDFSKAVTNVEQRKSLLEYLPII